MSIERSEQRMVDKKKFRNIEIERRGDEEKNRDSEIYRQIESQGILSH